MKLNILSQSLQWHNKAMHMDMLRMTVIASVRLTVHTNVILVSLKNMDKYKTPLYGYSYKINLSIYFDKLYNILTKYCPYNY